MYYTILKMLLNALSGNIKSGKYIQNVWHFIQHSIQGFVKHYGFSFQFSNHALRLSAG